MKRIGYLILGFIYVFAVERALRGQTPPPEKLATVSVATGSVRSGHPRVLLTPPAIAILKRNAQTGTIGFRRLQAACDKVIAEDIPSGYEAFDWGDAVANLALCWRATGNDRYAQAGVRYLNALYDDKNKLGDGQGGDTVVQHDDGYPIRTYGVYAALGYDWLYDAPSFTNEMKQRAARRIGAWLKWYGEEGYLRDKPISNYFCGYLTATLFGGLALAGDTPAAAGWLEHGRRELLGSKLLPTYARDLKGGDWPEGWQYGELSLAEVALVAHALKTATGNSLVNDLPWLKETIDHHMHALVPGSSQIYDNGDWSEHPTKPSALGLTAVALALDDDLPEVAARARWMVNQGLPSDDEHLWLYALYERPGKKEIDPHVGAATSIHLAGTGLTFFRSAWSPSAVWLSFQSGPTIADHQHNDQGHFEIWRGKDALLVDGGTYNSAATVSHNSLLVDDNRKWLPYSPNQGTWGRAKTLGFGDDGLVGVVVGDIADAYAPKCVEEGCTGRAVHSAKRTLVFVRPNLTFVHDEVELDDAQWGVTYLNHVTKAPKIAGSGYTVSIGTSRLDALTLLPQNARLAVKKEPAPVGKEEGPYRQNDPWGPMWRIEVTSPKGSSSREFLHVLNVQDAAAAPLGDVQLLEGAGAVGARALSADGQIRYVMFVSGDGEHSLTLPSYGAHQRLVVVGTSDKTRVRFTKQDQRCLVTVPKAPARPGAAAYFDSFSCGP